MEGDAVHRAAGRLDALAGAYVARTDLRLPAVAAADLSGAALASNRAHGKHLLTRFDNGVTLHSHLRMRGSWSIVRKHRRALRPRGVVVPGVPT